MENPYSLKCLSLNRIYRKDMSKLPAKINDNKTMIQQQKYVTRKVETLWETEKMLLTKVFFVTVNRIRDCLIKNSLYLDIL